MGNDFEIDIVGFCGYCHNEIKADEDYIVVDGQKYHIECNKIRNRYYDNFEIGE